MVEFNVDKSNVVANNVTMNEYSLWHRRLAHPGQVSLKQLINRGLFGTHVANNESHFCEACKLAKSSQLPHYHSAGGSNAREVLWRVHSDVCEITGIGEVGKRYFVTFTDEFSRFTYVYFLDNKDEVFEVFKKFCIYGS